MVTIYLKEDLKEDLTEMQIKILELLKSNKFITQKEISSLIGINEKNTRNNIAVLKNKGLLKRVGGRKMGYWQTINKI